MMLLRPSLLLSLPMLCSVYSTYDYDIMIHFRHDDVVCVLCSSWREGKKGREANQSGGYLQKGGGPFCFCKSTSLTFLSERPDRNSNCSSITPTAFNLATTFWVAVASPEQIGINPNVDLCRLSLILQESKSRGASIGAAAVIKRTLLQPETTLPYYN